MFLRRNVHPWHIAHCFSRLPNTLSCYLLLLLIIHWDQYKIFWWAAEQSAPQAPSLSSLTTHRRDAVTEGRNDAQKGAKNGDGTGGGWTTSKGNEQQQQQQQQQQEHLFIYSSFLYNQRPPANFSGTPKVQLVVLFLAHKFHRSTDGMLCVVAKNAISVQKMALRKEIIFSLGLCALDLFVLSCTIDGLPRHSVLFDEPSSLGMSGGAGAESSSAARLPHYANHRNMYSLVLTDGPRSQRQSTKLTLYPKQPSYESRGLVLCMSRVFLFEKWQLLITALETYRLFKVDLVVAYVQSAILAVFELMRAYEREGLLKIRPGIRFPHLRGMPWDPNAETEFNGQILLAHECFYEYRESAQFIGLIDWDDLLVPSNHFGTLPAAFAAAFAVRPDTAYFLVNKLEASFEEQLVTRPTRFNLRKLLLHGIRAAAMYNDEKMVVRPKALRGFWMHNSFNVESRKQAVKMYTNYTILLHLANEERVNPSEFQVPFMTKFDIDGMHMHAFRLLKNLEKKFPTALRKLPTTQPYYEALVACHSQIFAYYKSTGMGKSRCLSYSLCVLPELPETICAITRNTFATMRSKSAKSVIHVREQAEFGHGRCSDEGGI